MENDMNLFEYAAREKLRFPTVRGLLATEDVFDLPLTHASGFDLDSVAKAVNSDLKATEEESFVKVGTNPRRKVFEAQLNILKHIIALKQREQQDRLARAGRAAERARLLEVLEKKDQEKMLGMSADEVRARIAELDAA